MPAATSARGRTAEETEAIAPQRHRAAAVRSIVRLRRDAADALRPPTSEWRSVAHRRFRGHNSNQSGRPFELRRADTADRRVPAFRLVGAFDGIGHAGPRRVARSQTVRRIRSVFGGEKSSSSPRFPDVPRSAHRGGDAGERLRLSRDKTGGPAVMPVGAPSMGALDSTERKSPIVLVNGDGHPWTPGGFRPS